MSPRGPQMAEQWRQSRVALAASQEFLGDGLPHFAAARAFQAVLCGASALMLFAGKDASQGRAVIAHIHKDYVRKGRLGPEMGRIINRLSDIRDVCASLGQGYVDPVEARLAALRELSSEGVSTWAFIGPVLPYLTEEGIEHLLNELAGSVSHILFDRLNVKAGNMPDIRRALSERYPDLKPLFESALRDESEYYAVFKRKAADMCRRRSIPFEMDY